PSTGDVPPSAPSASSQAVRATFEEPLSGSLSFSGQACDDASAPSCTEDTMPPTRIAAMIALTLAIVPLTACPPFGAPGNPSASPSPTQPPNPGTSGSLDTHFGEAGVATAEVTPDWED